MQKKSQIELNNFFYYLKLLFGLGLEEPRPITERRNYVRLITSIALPFTLAFALVNWISGFDLLAAIELVIACICLIPILFLLDQDRYLAISENLLVAYGLSLSLALVSFGGVEGTGILWVFAVPFGAFLLKGQKSGWMISLFWIALMFTGLHYGHILSGVKPYQGGFVPQTYAAMLLYTLLAGSLNLVRSRFEQLLTEQVRVNTQKAQQSLADLQYLASHDHETGLPNLANIYNRIEKMIENTEPANALRIQLYIMHLDRYTEISNILGEDGAKKLQESIIETLNKSMPEEVVIARENNDEFIFLIDHSMLTADHTPDTLFTDLELTYNIDGFDIEIEYTLGAAFYPDHADDASSLLNRTEQALLLARAQKKSFFTYNSEQEKKFVREHMLFGKLRKALGNDEIFLHYQPKYDLASNRIIGVETLARWTDQSGNSISPGEFIPIAENSGLIHAFTRKIIEQGFITQKAWQEQGIFIKMSLNLSIHNILDEQMAGFLEQLLKKYRVKASSFVLEITEGSFSELGDTLVDSLNHLHQLGFALSIDDFGTGYSSLSYLKDLPVDELKIDQSFVKNILDDRRGEALVKSIINMAHNLGLSIVAEGIETVEQHNWLREANCQIGQGFGFSRPLPFDDFLDFFHAKQLHLQHD